MKNEEIDRLLFVMGNDVDKFKGLRELLQDEKLKNRQEVFKEYLNTEDSVIKEGKKVSPLLFYNDVETIFTNSISLYVVKSQFFKPSIEEISSNNERKKFKLVEKEEINNLLNKVENFYGNIDELCDLWGDPINTVESEFAFLGELYRDYFNQQEIDVCNQILNDPIYRNSVSDPILKAESEIGKAYILGKKRCQE